METVNEHQVVRHNGRDCTVIHIYKQYKNICLVEYADNNETETVPICELEER